MYEIMPTLAAQLHNLCVQQNNKDDQKVALDMAKENLKQLFGADVEVKRLRFSEDGVSID